MLNGDGKQGLADECTSSVYISGSRTEDAAVIVAKTADHVELAAGVDDLAGELRAGGR
jgi:hypothetical protein